MAVALVTGASRGIGRACSVELAALGYDVAVNYVSNDQAALDTVNHIRSLGKIAEAFKSDISNHSDAQKLVENVERQMGPVEALVLNAGITKDTLLVRMTESHWDTVVGTNLKGAFNITKWVLRSMMKGRKGSIVAISSVVALTGNMGQANYCASKAGVIGFVRAVAKEGSRYGITANVVAPGYIQTDMTASLPEAVKQRLEKAIPLERLGTPEDVGRVVGFLVSPAASYITGQVLPVDGGMSMGSLT